MYFYYCIIIIYTLSIMVITTMKGYNMNKSTMTEASTNWDVYIKECMQVAASSITPYKIIPYKKYNGIKQAIIEKQVKEVA